MKTLPEWFADLDQPHIRRAIHVNDGIVWAVVQTPDAWLYQERDGDRESFETLTALVERLSDVQRRLFGTTVLEARQQDCVPELIDLLEAGKRLEALALLEQLEVEPASSGTLPETEADACRRLAHSLRRTAEEIADGRVRLLDKALGHVRRRLESKVENVEDEALIALMVEHDEARLITASTVFEFMLETNALGLLTQGEAIEDYRSFAVKPGGPVCPDLFAGGRWAHVPLPDPIPHPRCASLLLEAVPVPPPELLGAESVGEFFRGPFKDVWKKLLDRTTRAVRLRQLDAPGEIIQNETDLIRRAVTAACEAADVPALDTPYPNIRSEIPIERAPAGRAGVGVVSLPKELHEGLTPKDRFALVQLPDELRLYDASGLVRTFPGCAWRLVAGKRNWAVFVGENPRVEDGEVREVAVLDTTSGEWRDTWPTPAAVGHLLRSLDALTIVEPFGDGYCVTDPINNKTQVLEPPTHLMAWNPIEDVVWGERNGEQLAMRVYGEIFALRMPQEFDQVYDADTGTVMRGRRATAASVEPILKDDNLFHMTAEGRIGLRDEPVLELEGAIEAVSLQWPCVAVLTATHVTTLLVDSFDEYGGDDARVLWRHRID